MAILPRIRYDRDTVIARVEFGFFALAARRSIGCILAHGHASTVFPPLQVVRAFGVAFRLPVDDDEIGFDSAVGRQDDRAVPRAIAGFDSFGEVDFLACLLATGDTPIQLAISLGITDVQVQDYKGTGGEGGIRTLGTGVSPYNGLASVTILVMRNNVKGLQSGQRLGIGCSRPHSAFFVLHFVLHFRVIFAVAKQEKNTV